MAGKLAHLAWAQMMKISVPWRSIPVEEAPKQFVQCLYGVVRSRIWGVCRNNKLVLNCSKVPWVGTWRLDFKFQKTKVRIISGKRVEKYKGRFFVLLFIDIFPPWLYCSALLEAFPFVSTRAECDKGTGTKVLRELTPGQHPMSSPCQDTGQTRDGYQRAGTTT